MGDGAGSKLHSAICWTIPMSARWFPIAETLGSERKTAEEKQRRQSEELRRSNSELQAFAYAPTHDLREPLRTVSAFTQLLILVQNAGHDGKSKQRAEWIVAGVNRMSTLLDDLLTFASLSS